VQPAQNTLPTEADIALVRRTFDLESMGMIVLRFWNDDVLLRTEAVLEEMLASLGAPHPDPLPAHGERERMARLRTLRRARGSP